MLILLDLDGTLAATAPDIVRSINLLLAESGVARIDAGAAAKHVGSGAGAEMLIRGAFAHSGRDLPQAEVMRLLARYFEVYFDNLCVESRLYDGCVEALDRLAAAGHRLAVCTNKPTSHARALMEQLGVADRFAAICGRDLFAAHKPDARHVQGTVAEAGGPGDGVVLVGDSETDFAAARNAGIPLILARFGYGAEAVLKLGPDAVIGAFHELPAVIDSLRLPA